MLDIKNLTIKFGGLVAVSNFSLTIGEKEVVGLIGPNGAGKTTVFNMLTGVYTPTSGTISYLGEDIKGLKPYIITSKKIARTFQNIRLFSDLSVLDNVKISYDYKLLKTFNLLDKCYEKASNLSYGEQRRLEIVRALATGPKLLLLDEPAAGMNPQETAELSGLIKWIRDTYDVSILLIEHDMKLVMGICDKITVLDYGKVIAVGSPDEIKNNPKVIKAYLGEEATVNA